MEPLGESTEDGKILDNFEKWLIDNKIIKSKVKEFNQDLYVPALFTCLDKSSKLTKFMNLFFLLLFHDNQEFKKDFDNLFNFILTSTSGSSGCQFLEKEIGFKKVIENFILFKYENFILNEKQAKSQHLSPKIFNNINIYIKKKNVMEFLIHDIFDSNPDFSKIPFFSMNLFFLENHEDEKFLKHFFAYRKTEEPFYHSSKEELISLEKKIFQDLNEHVKSKKKFINEKKFEIRILRDWDTFHILDFRTFLPGLEKEGNRILKKLDLDFKIICLHVYFLFFLSPELKFNSNKALKLIFSILKN